MSASRPTTGCVANSKAAPHAFLKPAAASAPSTRANAEPLRQPAARAVAGGARLAGSGDANDWEEF